VAREYLLALPVELTHAQRVGMVKGFARELSERYRFAVDVAIHAPRDFPGSDPRNFHAHLMATTREVSLDGLASKTALELSDACRRELGLGPSIHELLHVRERWAAVANEALKDAKLDARIDHRGRKAQGISREAPPWIPRVPYEIERRGFRSVVAERLRADYEARLQARLEIPMQRHEGEPLREGEKSREGETLRGHVRLEDVRRQARENWLRLRRESARGVAGPEEPAGDGRMRDEDLSR